ncbi:lachesin-like [Macrobrachium nipponense]|uniref:lachesin-like n=1 Tax=Macrobrachium nipponense TaxID=159736 RepID=UPI0030C8BCA2
MEDKVILMIIAATLCHLGGSSSEDISVRGAQREDQTECPGDTTATFFEGMTAEQQNNTEVVAQVGGTATIKCYTHFQGDETVTWIKKDEDHLLTAGGQVYSSEARYSVTHERQKKLWALSVRDVRKSDAGLYECQLTTHPPTSLFFTLNVVEARAVIQGGQEVHVHTGVKLKLHCKVELATQPPQYIFWYHNNTMVNFEHSRPLKVVGDEFSSTLIISNLTWEDAGSYTCEAHKAHPANITMHVIGEEKHAALHKDNGVSDEACTLTSTYDDALRTALLVLWATYTYGENFRGFLRLWSLR